MSGITPEGKPLIAGLFVLKDQEGFPLDMAYEKAKEYGEPDWAECLADAGRRGIKQYDSVTRELGFLLGPDVRDDIENRFNMWGAINAEPGDDFMDVCSRMRQSKWEKRAS